MVQVAEPVLEHLQWILLACVNACPRMRVCVHVRVPVWIAGRLLAHGSVLCRRALLG